MVCKVQAEVIGKKGKKNRDDGSDEGLFFMKGRLTCFSFAFALRSLFFYSL
jgi:hypothetical protein